jgi:transcriptional regulator GlxA family with amidase domain
MTALRESHPRVMFTPELFVIDRDRCTCTGGIAPLDFILHLITPRVGRELAVGISEQFILERVRDTADQQRIPLAVRLGGHAAPLVQAAQLMEAHLEEPLSLDEVASRVDVSTRQLQRLFRHRLGVTPAQYYINLRLRRARELLLQTSMPVMSITVACGFASAGHFSKSYRSLFGRSPSAERRLGAAAAHANTAPRAMSQKR